MLDNCILTISGKPDALGWVHLYRDFDCQPDVIVQLICDAHSYIVNIYDSRHRINQNIPAAIGSILCSFEPEIFKIMPVNHSLGVLSDFYYTYDIEIFHEDLDLHWKVTSTFYDYWDETLIVLDKKIANLYGKDRIQRFELNGVTYSDTDDLISAYLIG